MPAYAYTGLNPAGKTVKGVETADNVGALKAEVISYDCRFEAL